MQALTTDTRFALRNLLTTFKMHTRKGSGQGTKQASEKVKLL